MHQWRYILTLGRTSCSFSQLITLQKVKPWLNARAQTRRQEVRRPAIQHIRLRVWGGRKKIEKSKKSPVSYLEEENELREALDGLHHQAVERDAVHASRLLPLLTKKRRYKFDSRKCICLLVYFFLQRNIIGGRGGVGSTRFCCSESKHVGIPGWEGVGVRVGERERERYENCGPLVIRTDKGGNSSHVLCVMRRCRRGSGTHNFFFLLFISHLPLRSVNSETGNIC